MKATKRPQRIKMQIQDHPVKWDGEIVHFYDDGSFKVHFDGPLKERRFYPYHGNVVTADTEARNVGNVPASVEFWVILR